MNLTVLDSAARLVYAPAAQVLALRAVVDALPRCKHPGCTAPATRVYAARACVIPDPEVCDDPAHAPDPVDFADLPYARALRTLARVSSGDICPCDRCDAERRVEKTKNRLRVCEHLAKVDLGDGPARAPSVPVVLALRALRHAEEDLAAAPACPRASE